MRMIIKRLSRFRLSFSYIEEDDNNDNSTRMENGARETTIPII